MNNIILCTDCSENAQKAIDQCLYLFKDQPTNYLMLYTYNIEERGISNLVNYNDALKIKVNACLESELKRINKLSYAQNISISARSVFGKTENVLKRFVAKSKVDLVVIGNQGSNYSSNQLFGSTTKKLLFELERPKLIVPRHIGELSEKKKLVVAQDKELQNIEWWSTIPAFSKNHNMSFKLIVLPNNDTQMTHISIPSFVENQLSSILDFRQTNTTTINQKVKEVIQRERPSLLHLNVQDHQLTKQLLREDQPSNSICNSTPFIIQPFRF